METFFDENSESLVTYYVLPLLKVSFKAFGVYFKTAKISRDLQCVQVELITGCTEKYWEHPNCIVDWDEDGKTFVRYEIPEEFKEDIELFSLGKYSKISDKSKKLIFKHSGLLYNKQMDSMVVTDKRLLVLTKSPILKEWVEKAYRVKKGSKLEFIRLKNKESIYYD